MQWYILLQNFFNCYYFCQCLSFFPLPYYHAQSFTFSIIFCLLLCHISTCYLYSLCFLSLLHWLAVLQLGFAVEASSLCDLIPSVAYRLLLLQLFVVSSVFSVASALCSVTSPCCHLSLVSVLGSVSCYFYSEFVTSQHCALEKEELYLNHKVVLPCMHQWFVLFFPHMVIYMLFLGN